MVAVRTETEQLDVKDAIRLRLEHWELKIMTLRPGSYELVIMKLLCTCYFPEKNVFVYFLWDNVYSPYN